MHIVKLNAIDSTNTYLRQFAMQYPLQDYTVIYTDEQLSGRGQMGTLWISQPGKNLTFSVLKHFKGFPLEQLFFVNMKVSLAVFKTLRQLNIPDVHIKWPNDILSANAKIGGVLIENSVKNATTFESIIGIGLNVNQIEFNGLQSVSSLQRITGKTFDLDELLHHLVSALISELDDYSQWDLEVLQQEYEAQLFRINKPSTFKKQDGSLIMGFIRGVSETGKLIVELEDAIFQEFDLKEVKLLY